MAYITVRTYHCSMCRHSIKPFLALILSPSIECGWCKTRISVSRDLVLDTWNSNFYKLCVLLIWIGAIIYAPFMEPSTSSKSLPGGMIFPMIIGGWLFGIIFALPLWPIGYVLGHVAANLIGHAQQELRSLPPSYSYSTGRIPKEHEWQ